MTIAKLVEFKGCYRMLHLAGFVLVQPSVPGSRTSFLLFKMAETSLIFSAERTSFDPEVKGCLIIGQARHLRSVSYDTFSEKLSPRVDASVGK